MPNSARTIPRCPDGKTYGEGHRCDFCRRTVAAINAGYRYRVMQRERGVISPEDLIPADEVRELLVKIHKRGNLTDRDLEVITGLRAETISHIRRGKSTRCRRDTATAIFKALEYEDFVPERHPMTLVDGAWVRQMQLSLCAQGYTRQHQRDILKNNLGINAGFIQSRRAGYSGKVYWQNVQHMKWLLRAIGERPGPATAVAKTMQKRGIFPPRHYNVNGELIKSSLNAEQRQKIEGV